MRQGQGERTQRGGAIVSEVSVYVYGIGARVNPPKVLILPPSKVKKKVEAAGEPLVGARRMPRHS